ncbi:unnamed protein product [Clavelina lepadiformis]|uniref:ZP domain-containing protein n=1 Tax=Clavelina lepadiformis TaxID=159417 RepID=A0ABP0G411_CLALP
MRHSAFIALLYFLIMAHVESSVRKRRGLSGASYVVSELIDDSHITINCQSSNTSISVSSAYLETLTIKKVDKLVFLDETGVMLDGCDLTNRTEYNFNLNPLGRCAATVEEAEDKIFVNYTLCVVPATSEMVVSRDESVSFYFTCIYEAGVNVSEVDLNSEIKKISFLPAFQEGSFNVDIKQYTDASFDTVVVNSNVFVEERVYVGIYLDNGAGAGLVLQIKKCWGTPTPLSTDTRQFYFVENDGCASHDPWSPDSNIIHQNYANGIAGFSFKAYVWSSLQLSDQRIFVHCEVTICETAVFGAQCTNAPSCPSTTNGLNGRRRRSVESQGSRVITMDPVLVRQQSCQKEKVGCSHECAVSSVGEIICICPPSAILGLDGKTCVSESSVFHGHHQKTMVVVANHFTNAAIFVLMLVSIFACIGIFIGIYGQSRRRLVDTKLNTIY